MDDYVSMNECKACKVEQSKCGIALSAQTHGGQFAQKPVCLYFCVYVCTCCTFTVSLIMLFVVCGMLYVFYYCY